MTDELNSENTKKYLQEYNDAIKEGKPINNPSFWGGFNDGVKYARLAIVEQLLSTRNNLTLDELAAATFLNKEAVLGIQDKLINNETERQKNKNNLNERMVENERFSKGIIGLQAAKMVEQKKDILFLFKHIDKLNDAQDRISNFLTSTKDLVWCENDTKERNRIYSDALQNIHDVIDDYADAYVGGDINKYLDVVKKYAELTVPDENTDEHAHDE